jgi:hypothetical protein
MKDPRLILGIDPGGTTGICARYIPPGTDTVNPEHFKIAQAGSCNTDVGLQILFDILGGFVAQLVPYQGYAGEVIVVIENFDFRHEERYRDKIDYTAPEVIGAFRKWAQEYPMLHYFRKSAASAKGFWVDAKLKKLGLWVPGKRHAMDAQRHVMYHSLFQLDHQYLIYPFRPGGPNGVRQETTS